MRFEAGASRAERGGQDLQMQPAALPLTCEDVPTAGPMLQHRYAADGAATLSSDVWYPDDLVGQAVVPQDYALLVEARLRLLHHLLPLHLVADDALDRRGEVDVHHLRAPHLVLRIGRPDVVDYQRLAADRDAAARGEPRGVLLKHAEKVAGVALPRMKRVEGHDLPGLLRQLEGDDVAILPDPLQLQERVGGRHAHGARERRDHPGGDLEEGLDALAGVL
mmetsp:Transcript_12853/g.36985  ORF Transcript_12853/g.36985 Transcript_12853/m.36985 type:complete len:221 (-) Transcript_12853:951-1613(-)